MKRSTLLLLMLVARELGISRSLALDWPEVWNGDYNTSLTARLSDHAVPANAVQFSNRRSMLAVANEQGQLGVFDVERSAMPGVRGTVLLPDEHPECISFAHHNSVFDLCWLAGDDRIATASGDQRVHVHDVETRTLVHELVGHCGSVKAVRAGQEHQSALFCLESAYTSAVHDADFLCCLCFS